MRILKILLGPEINWIILFFSVALAWANKISGYAYDALMEKAWFYIPLLSVMVFGLYQIHFVEKNWLLLRIWISGIIMGHFVLEKILASFSSQGPGIGMGYLARMLLLFFLLAIGSIVVKLIH